MLTKQILAFQSYFKKKSEQDDLRLDDGLLQNILRDLYSDKINQLLTSGSNHHTMMSTSLNSKSHATLRSVNQEEILKEDDSVAQILAPESPTRNSVLRRNNSSPSPGRQAEKTKHE